MLQQGSLNILELHAITAQQRLAALSGLKNTQEYPPTCATMGMPTPAPLSVQSGTAGAHSSLLIPGALLQIPWQRPKMEQGQLRKG